MKHGFRVYSFEVGLRSRGKAQSLTASPGADFQENLVKVLDSLRQSESLFGFPNYRSISEEMADPEPGCDSLNVRSVYAVGNRVSCEFAHGRRGAHRDLIGDDEDRDISDHAASRRYRFDMYFPRADERGIIVAETINGLCPVNVLLRWIARRDAELRGGPESDWRRISVTQLGDTEHLRELITNAKKTTVRIMQRRFSQRGRPSSVEHELVLNEVDDGQSAELAEEVLSWVSKDRRDTGAVGRVMNVMGVSRKKLEQASFSFNYPEVILGDGEETKRLNPDQVRNMFTYRLSGDLRLDDVVWFERTTSKAHALSVAEGIPVDLD